MLIVFLKMVVQCACSAAPPPPLYNIRFDTPSFRYAPLCMYLCAMCCVSSDSSLKGGMGTVTLAMFPQVGECRAQAGLDKGAGGLTVWP